ncbi:hypothetical protein BDFB_004491 [Asbolus verrucosus]|uniref:Uncharacterized protein n=1 Tax=Asbolus verrucosus TaxID=1661398 RepID=A0A482VJG6_ASBVE|nr:hypothetical protein BDFB_004491 [Asbolus verrucosus]
MLPKRDILAEIALTHLIKILFCSHSSSKGSGKHGIALTALTLLSFLFFLNILQNCLQEHMDSMNPQVMIMQARTKELREIEAQKRKGEVQPELFNSSYGKESRNKPELKSQNYHLTQIPVKLRTNEKAVKP